MGEGSSYSPEHSPKQLEYKQDIVQYQDGDLALRLTGDRGAKFELGEKSIHKYDPLRSRMNEGIVRTKSGNDYYISHDDESGTYVVNIRETEKQGRLVAYHTDEFPATLPPIEFGKPWEIPHFYSTSDVRELLLRYKRAERGSPHYHQINNPDPFTRYKELLSKMESQNLATTSKAPDKY